MIASAERHGIDPQKYLTSVLAKIGQTKLSELGQFLPDVWKAEDANNLPSYGDGTFFSSFSNSASLKKPSPHLSIAVSGVCFLDQCRAALYELRPLSPSPRPPSSTPAADPRTHDRASSGRLGQRPVLFHGGISPGAQIFTQPTRNP